MNVLEGLRCRVTNNLCGTDPVVRGVSWPCSCNSCVIWFRWTGVCSARGVPAPEPIETRVQALSVEQIVRIWEAGMTTHTTKGDPEKVRQAMLTEFGAALPAEHAPPDPQFGIEIAHALRDAVFCEDGYEGGDALMWEVARRYGLRPAMVEHDESANCPLTGKHAFSECDSDLKNLVFEAGSRPALAGSRFTDEDFKEMAGAAILRDTDEAGSAPLPWQRLKKVYMRLALAGSLSKDELAVLTGWFAGVTAGKRAGIPLTWTPEDVDAVTRMFELLGAPNCWGRVSGTQEGAP